VGDQTHKKNCACSTTGVLSV